MLSISGKDSHEINLAKMEQTKVDNGFVRRIRIYQPTTVLPKQFIDQATSRAAFPDALFPNFEVKPSSKIIDMTRWSSIRPMYDCIAGKFAQTCFPVIGTDTTAFSLTSIEDRFDEMQWDAYQLKKKHMTKQLGEDKVNEMWLWHGTAPSSVNSILINGFERNLGSKMAFGDGVYFAVNSNYSFQDKFAKIETNSRGLFEKVLLLSRVLVGETCTGTLGKKTPDTKIDGTFCNSMTNDMQTKDMYILSAGSDSQSYIQFVLRFERH